MVAATEENHDPRQITRLRSAGYPIKVTYNILIDHGRTWMDLRHRLREGRSINNWTPRACLNRSRHCRAWRQPTPPYQWSGLIIGFHVLHLAFEHGNKPTPRIGFQAQVGGSPLFKSLAKVDIGRQEAVKDS